MSTSRSSMRWVDRAVGGRGGLRDWAMQHDPHPILQHAGWVPIHRNPPLRILSFYAKNSTNRLSADGACARIGTRGSATLHNSSPRQRHSSNDYGRG